MIGRSYASMNGYVDDCIKLPTECARIVGSCGTHNSYNGFEPIGNKVSDRLIAAANKMTLAELKAGELKCILQGEERACYGIFNDTFIFETILTKGVLTVSKKYVDAACVFPIPPKKKVSELVKVGNALRYIHSGKTVIVSLLNSTGTQYCYQSHNNLFIRYLDHLDSGDWEILPEF